MPISFRGGSEASSSYLRLLPSLGLISSWPSAYPSGDWHHCISRTGLTAYSIQETRASPVARSSHRILRFFGLTLLMSNKYSKSQTVGREDRSTATADSGSRPSLRARVVVAS